TEIELLWLTGELRLEKPTVAQELAWGLYFVNENLFDVVPELQEKLERALHHAYPDERWEVGPFFQCGSWIGGERTGHPFVTNQVTRECFHENRLASLRRYRQRLQDLLRGLSVTERAARVTESFRRALGERLAESGEGERIATRNPGEVFRQYLACVQRRLDATIACGERGAAAPEGSGYPDAEALIADLRTLETGVRDARCRGPGHRVPDLGPAESETLGMFRLIREMRDQLDREAIGSFVLSMTHDTDDVLGCYLLAKEAGLFADAAAIESCTLPIVPLFESIDGLRRAPEIMRELLQVPLV